MTTTDTIRFSCPSCGKSIKVPTDKAGKRGRCPACKEPIVVPEPEAEYELSEPETDWLDELPPATPTGTSSAAHRPPATASVGWKEVISSDVWIGVGLGGPVLLWLVFLLFAVTGIDLLGSSDTSADADKISTMGMLYLVLGFSVVCLPIGLFRYQRAKRLLTSGVEIDYEVLKYSGVRQGMLDATIQYDVGGKTYKKKVTIAEDMAEDGFHLIVDPDKPKRVIARPIDK